MIKIKKFSEQSENFFTRLIQLFLFEIKLQKEAKILAGFIGFITSAISENFFPLFLKEKEGEEPSK